MNHDITSIIDKVQCTGCGLCGQICPSQAISLVNSKAKITGDCSFSCDHCAAICPAGAIRIMDLDESALEFSTLQQNKHWLPPGETDIVGLVRLMRSRRSVRIYQDKPVAPEILADLIKIGTTAPSGTNSQRWTFTIVPGRQAADQA